MQHQLEQLGSARQQHQGVDLRAVVRHPNGQWVAAARAFNLRRERAAIAGAHHQNLAELASALNGEMATRNHHIGLARNWLEFLNVHRTVLVRATCAEHHHHHQVGRVLHAMARQLAADAGRTLARLAPHECSQRNQEQGVVMHHVAAGETAAVMLGNEAGVEVTGGELRVRQQGRLERDVARHAADYKGIQRCAHAADSVGAVCAVHDELGDHRVVMHGDFAAFEHAGVDANAALLGLRLRGLHRCRWWCVTHEPARGRQEAAERVFGVDAAFHGPTAPRNLSLGERQRLAGCDANHLFHQVDARDAFRDRVLHLQPGVHFEEIKTLVLADYEFDGARALVIHRLRQLHRLRAHRSARGFADERRRGFFNHFLVPALDGAFAFVQINHVAVGVTQHLDFDVPRLFNEFLDEHPVIAKTVLGFVAARAETFESFLVAGGHAQPFAAAASTGLDHHRVANVLGNRHRLFGRFDGRVPARNGVDLGRQCQLLRGDLVAHGGDAFVLGSDEDNAFRLKPPRELRVLREESVTRVYRLRARGFAGIDDFLYDEITLAAGCRADQDRFVGELDMQCVAVGFGIDSDRSDAHPPGRLDNAAGDLPAVRDKNLGKHGGCLYKGMLPCLRHGFSSFLSRNMARDRQSRLRVSCG